METRENIRDDEWKYIVFDDFADRAAKGEFTRERAWEMYLHVVDVTVKLGDMAVGGMRPDREQ